MSLSTKQIEILSVLKHNSLMKIKDIADMFNMKLNTCSYQITQLEKFGYIEKIRGREGRKNFFQIKLINPDLNIEELRILEVQNGNLEVQTKPKISAKKSTQKTSNIDVDDFDLEEEAIEREKSEIARLNANLLEKELALREVKQQLFDLEHSFKNDLKKKVGEKDLKIVELEEELLISKNTIESLNSDLNKQINLVSELKPLEKINSELMHQISSLQDKFFDSNKIIPHAILTYIEAEKLITKYREASPSTLRIYNRCIASAKDRGFLKQWLDFELFLYTKGELS